MHALRSLLPLGVFALAVVAGCSTTTPESAEAPPAAVSAVSTASPTLAGSARVFDGSGAEVSLQTLLEDLSGADAVFLGETHLDDVTHRTELEILRGLADRTANRVVLSLEMFERDVQSHLDRYLAGEIDEPTFLAHARPWGNYRTGYRPLIELARERGLPVVAANFPAPLRFKIRGSRENWDALTDEERRFVPRELHPNSELYWGRVDQATRGHAHMGGGGSRTPEDRLLDGQSLWDNAMGESVADAVRAHPDHIVLHVVGGFHVRDREGTVSQTLVRAPETDVRVVQISPRFDLAEATAAASHPDDFVVLTAARARDVNDGRWGVEVGGELRYRVEVPAGATDLAPVPLLVWLGPDGARDTDGLRYWRLALGEEAAVVALDPVHLNREPDLRLGGRWWWGETFGEDLTRTRRGVSRVLDYVVRRFPVDLDRIVVAGQGTGGTMALWAALAGGAEGAATVAVAPAELGRLDRMGLPSRAGDRRTMDLVVAPAQTDGLSSLVDDLRGAGIDAELVPDDSPLVAAEDRIRERLRIAPRKASSTAPRAVRLLTETDTARRWAELVVRASASSDQPLSLTTAASAPLLEIGLGADHVWSPDVLRRPGVVPPAPGPFGGTTVIVVPADADEAERAAWDDLVANDPLAARSRFHRIVLAHETGGKALPDVLRELASAGRRNVLIVPGLFCASADRMRVLRAAAAPAAEGMTLEWTPGLGDRLHRVR